MLRTTVYGALGSAEAPVQHGPMSWFHVKNSDIVVIQIEWQNERCMTLTCALDISLRSGSFNFRFGQLMFYRDGATDLFVGVMNHRQCG